MKRLRPYLHVTPRIDRDIDDCLAFVARQPWGKPNDRRLDIWRGITRVLALPEANRPEEWRPRQGFWLRRCNAAQFVIVLAWLALPAQRFLQLTSQRLQKKRLFRHHPRLYAALAQRV